METLYLYEVKVYKDKGQYPWNQDMFTNEKVSIACQNEDYIIIDDWYFTKLKKEKCNYDNYLNNPNITIRVGDTLFDNGVFYKLYSEKPVTPIEIKRQIEDAIIKKIGWLIDGIDLSMIK